MPISCVPKSVLSNNSCIENPAGLSNFLYAVPVKDLDISASDEANQYTIANNTVEGYRIDYKSQTGQYTSEDNGTGKGWSSSATGRVELNEDEMAWTSRVLHNSDKYVYFIATGKKVKDGDDTLDEFIVVGNENGEAEWAVAADSGTTRQDDHGQTFTISCGYQLYPLTKWHGVITQKDGE